MNWYYYSPDGQAIEGPVSKEELHRLVASGVLSTRHHVVLAGEKEWRTIDTVFPEIGITSTPPPLPPPAPATVVTPANAGRAARSWFGNLKPKQKLAVILAAGFLFLLVIAGAGGGNGPAPNTSNPQGGNQPSQVNEEAIFRQLDAMTPKNQHACPVCGGSGQLANTQSFNEGLVAEGSHSSRCETCLGQGTIRTKSGFETTCPTCSGLGSKKTRPCYKCGGTGQVWGY